MVTASVQAAMETPAFWSFPTVTLICMALGTLLISTKWALQVSATFFPRTLTRLLRKRPWSSRGELQGNEKLAENVERGETVGYYRMPAPPTTKCCGRRWWTRRGTGREAPLPKTLLRMRQLPVIH